MLPKVVLFFIGLDRIVAAYEPADPLLNGYNLNVLFENDSDALVEVVGPGFDASDLQRGDLSPHETWSVSISPSGVSEMKLIQRITKIDYQKSLQARRQKIKNKLESCPTPELARTIQKELGIPADLEAHLLRLNSPLLTARTYQPLAKSVIKATIGRIAESNVISIFRSQTRVSFPLVISTSFVNRGRRQVFWDIVSPSLKYEA